MKIMIINGKILGDIVARATHLLYDYEHGAVCIDRVLSYAFGFGKTTHLNKSNEFSQAYAVLFDMIDICFVVYELRWQQLNSEYDGGGGRSIITTHWMEESNFVGVVVALCSLINFLCKHTMHSFDFIHSSFLGIASSTAQPFTVRDVAWQSIVHHHRETGYRWLLRMSVCIDLGFAQAFARLKCICLIVRSFGVDT